MDIWISLSWSLSELRLNSKYFAFVKKARRGRNGLAPPTSQVSICTSPLLSHHHPFPISPGPQYCTDLSASWASHSCPSQGLHPAHCALLFLEHWVKRKSMKRKCQVKRSWDSWENLRLNILKIFSRQGPKVCVETYFWKRRRTAF